MKSWRDGAEKWPGHRYDLALTDHYTPAIRDELLALVDLLNVPDLIDRYGSSIQKAAEDDERAELIAKIIAGLSVRDASLKGLRVLLEQAMAEGFATGAHAAAEVLGAHAVTIPGALGHAIAEVAWEKWKPGDTLALGEVAAGALRENLGNLGIVVRGIADTSIDTIGNHIGSGLLAGHSSEKIERDIRDIVGSKARAEMIAHTEVARAQTSASLLVYELSGVTEYDLELSDGACEECVDIAAEGPFPLASDVGRVPIHPRCRCANPPVVSSIDPSLIQTRDAEQE